METGGMFDWTYFDNWNRRSSVWRPSKVGMFDSDLVRLIQPTNWVKQNIIHGPNYNIQNTAQLIPNKKEFPVYFQFAEMLLHRVHHGGDGGHHRSGRHRALRKRGRSQRAWRSGVSSLGVAVVVVVVVNVAIVVNVVVVNIVAIVNLLAWYWFKCFCFCEVLTGSFLKPQTGILFI